MWWRGGYPLQLETSKGIKTIRVETDEIRSAECPKSVALRSPADSDLVQILTKAQTVGDSPFGSSERWPGWFYDAAEIVKNETARDEAAQQRAVHRP